MSGRSMHIYVCMHRCCCTSFWGELLAASIPHREVCYGRVQQELHEPDRRYLQQL